MVLRIFNKYIPFHKLAFFLIDSIFIMGTVMLGAYLPFWGDPTRFVTYGYLFPKTLLIMATIQLSLYYFDLYDFKIFRSNLELVIRLLQSLGVASIVLAVIYHLFSNLIIGRGIFLISLGFMGGVIVSWRIIYNYILRTRQLDQKVMIIGSGGLAKNIAREILDREDIGF
jgi:FlaA1/EpsC-like NDP-sugar epimerase